MDLLIWACAYLLSKHKSIYIGRKRFAAETFLRVNKYKYKYTLIITYLP